jgi:hypothetical protein
MPIIRERTQPIGRNDPASDRIGAIADPAVDAPRPGMSTAINIAVRGVVRAVTNAGLARIVKAAAGQTVSAGEGMIGIGNDHDRQNRNSRWRWWCSFSREQRFSIMSSRR